MTNLFNEIKEKINNELNPEQISLIDNSHLHIKHQSFVSGKFHLKLIVKSQKLKKMKKIEAHKIIFSILKNEMKEKIHALEIKII